MLVASCYSSPLLAKHRCLECWGPCSRRHPAGVPVGKNPWKTHFCYKGFVRILRYNSSWTWVSSFMTSTTSQPSNIYGSRVKSVLCIYIYIYIVHRRIHSLPAPFWNTSWCFRVGISRLERLWESTTRIIQAGGDLCLKQGFGSLLLQHVERQIDLFDTLGFCWRCTVYILDAENELEI